MAPRKRGFLANLLARFRSDDTDLLEDVLVSRLPALRPPRQFEPREDEAVHALALAAGLNVTRGVELGHGTLIVTNLGVSFVTSEKNWRISWRIIEDTHAAEPQKRLVTTKRGTTFSFSLSSAEEAAALNSTIKILIEELDA